MVPPMLLSNVDSVFEVSVSRLSINAPCDLLYPYISFFSRIFFVISLYGIHVSLARMFGFRRTYIFLVCTTVDSYKVFGMFPAFILSENFSSAAVTASFFKK